MRTNPWLMSHPTQHANATRAKFVLQVRPFVLTATLTSHYVLLFIHFGQQCSHTVRIVDIDELCETKGEKGTCPSTCPLVGLSNVLEAFKSSSRIAVGDGWSWVTENVRISEGCCCPFCAETWFWNCYYVCSFGWKNVSRATRVGVFSRRNLKISRYTFLFAGISFIIYEAGDFACVKNSAVFYKLYRLWKCSRI